MIIKISVSQERLERLVNCLCNMATKEDMNEGLPANRRQERFYYKGFVLLVDYETDTLNYFRPYCVSIVGNPVLIYSREWLWTSDVAPDLWI